jgi:KDO2-lipid IV(A) lauroyltransferase
LKAQTLQNLFIRKPLRWAIVLLAKVSCFVPETIGRVCVGFIGLALHLISLRRSHLFASIDRVYYRAEKKSPQPLFIIIKRLFLHFALTGYELLRLPLYDKAFIEEIFIFEGWEHVETALKKNKGLILVVPHIGNWELLGAAITLKGYKLHSFVVGDQKKSILGETLNYLREYSQVTLHDRDRESIGALRALKAGAILAMIAYQDGGAHGIYCDFLNHWVSIPAGPANWSLKIDTPIINAHCLRIGNSRRFRAVFSEPLPVEAGQTHEMRMLSRTKKILTWMETVILQNPHQYLWFYDRFRPRHEAHIAKLKQSGGQMLHGEMRCGTI